MIFIKKHFSFIILFVFIFLIYDVIAFPSIYRDPISHYAFSHAIVMGEIPYVDFNLIAPPLYTYLMSIGLVIYDHFIVFLMESAFLMTIMFYFLKKMLGNKIYILLLTILLLTGDPICATYNSLVLFFLVLLIYLEKNHNDNDILIGITIGLAILSKHTIGIFFIIPTIIFYWKKSLKQLKRMAGVILVGIVFILYLLLTKSFYSFWDLCILGLLDFANKNGRVFCLWHIVGFVLLIVSLFLTIKNKKKIENYYFLMSFFFMVPLFDFGHFAIYLFCFVMQLLFCFSFSIDKYKKVFIIAIILFSVLLRITYHLGSNSIFVKDMKHIQYISMAKNDYDISTLYFDYFDQYKNATLLSYSKMLYDITRDNKIDYYNVLLYGNHGYNGTKKMIDKIKNTHNHYYIVDMESYAASYERSQFNKEIVNYIRETGEFVEKKYVFEVYYMK